MQASARLWRHFDVWLLAAVGVVTILGVAMIRSAIAGNETLAETAPRQTIYAVIGLAVLLLTAGIDYRMWSAVARPLYLVVVVVLALVPLSGFAGFGAARWFDIGIAFVQPSELAKVALILVLAEYFSRHQQNLDRWRVILRSLPILGAPAALLFIQPDLSSVIDLGVIWLTLVWASGVPLRRLALLAGAAVVVVLAAWPLLAPYQQARVASFLFPDPGATLGDTYNVNQALISIGSGGLFGQGYGQGTQVQLRFLKVRHTDFIFSAMAEEFGFVGAVALLALLAFVLLRCLRAARNARDPFGALVAYGVGTLMLFQVAANIGMNLNLVPVSGVPLPFFSYGGSSLVANLFAIGLVESITLRHKVIDL